MRKTEINESNEKIFWMFKDLTIKLLFSIGVYYI